MESTRPPAAASSAASTPMERSGNLCVSSRVSHGTGGRWSGGRGGVPGSGTPLQVQAVPEPPGSYFLAAGDMSHRPLRSTALSLVSCEPAFRTVRLRYMGRCGIRVRQAGTPGGGSAGHLVSLWSGRLQIRLIPMSCLGWGGSSGRPGHRLQVAHVVIFRTPSRRSAQLKRHVVNAVFFGGDVPHPVQRPVDVPGV